VRAAPYLRRTGCQAARKPLSTKRTLDESQASPAAASPQAARSSRPPIEVAQASLRVAACRIVTSAPLEPISRPNRRLSPFQWTRPFDLSADLTRQGRSGSLTIQMRLLARLVRFMGRTELGSLLGGSKSRANLESIAGLDGSLDPPCWMGRRSVLGTFGVELGACVVTAVSCRRGRAFGQAKVARTIHANGSMGRLAAGSQALNRVRLVANSKWLGCDAKICIARRDR
jgi:hypothetical protein